MRKILLAGLAVIGVLMTGCTATSTIERAEPEPAGATVATDTEVDPGCDAVAPDGSCIPTLATVPAGRTVWVDELSFVNLTGPGGIPCGDIDVENALIADFSPADLQPAALADRPMFHWLVKHPDVETYTFQWMSRDGKKTPVYKATRTPDRLAFYTGRDCPK